jgi:acetyl-CoA synthetase
MSEDSTATAAETIKDLHAHVVDKVYSPKLTGNRSATTSMEEYKSEHESSVRDPSKYWGEKASLLSWFHPFHTVMQGDFHHGDVAWFVGGKLNVCFNSIDRHVANGKGDDIALIWEGDEPNDIRKLNFSEIMRKTCQISNALKSQGVRKGSVVTIYMPMIPELLMTMLACARIGAIHSVVFAGFSSEALAQRISAAESPFVVTCDIGRRAGKTIALKKIVNDARSKLNCEDLIQQILVFERFYDSTSEVIPYEMKAKDVRMDPLVAVQRPYCVPEVMDAEDGLFLLYTSGSTGKPKGLLHTTGGYALYAMLTTKITFDLEPGDLFACVADCGWITGHCK